LSVQPPVDEDAFTAEQAAVAAVNQSFYQAVEDGDLDLVRSLWVDGEYADTAHCVHPGQPAVHGRQQVLMSWAVVMSRLSYLQFFITDVRVVVADALAVVSCVENVLTDISSGDEAQSGALSGGRAEAVNVFRRTSDGEWRLFAHHSSPVFPATEPDAAPDSDE
jgi:uncharacterized protein (TIGR02246 family)